MSPLLRKLNRPVLAVLAVGLIAGTLRFTHLGYPQQRIFDEYYYSKSACIYLGYSNDRCDVNSSDERYWRENRNDTGAWVHPPLGKWMIAVGELAVGTDSYGWRVSSAVTGTATVMLLAVIVQLLFGSPLWTFVGGLLLAVESLNFVQSRTAMLDIFVTFWIVLGFVFLLLDRRWIERRTPEPSDHGAEPLEAPAPGWGAAEAPAPGSGSRPGRPSLPLPTRSALPARPARVPAPIWRPWRFAAGVALGAGFATKWSAATAIACVVLLSFLWEVTRRRRFGARRPILEAIPAEGFGLVLAFVVVPALVYLGSYGAWFAHFGWSLREWFHLQADIFDYHRHLQTVDPATGEPVHPYLSQAWKWILLYRPVLYYADYGDGVRQVIYANGNPAIFWGGLLAIPYVAFAWATAPRLAGRLRGRLDRRPLPPVVPREPAAVPVLRDAHHAVPGPRVRVRAARPVRDPLRGPAVHGGPRSLRPALPARRGRVRRGRGGAVRLVLADADGRPALGRGLVAARLVPELDLTRGPRGANAAAGDGR